MKKLMLSAIVAMGFVARAYAAESDDTPDEGIKKVVLKLAAVETPNTRVSKWNPPNPPMTLSEVPHNEAEIASASPEVALEMVRENRRVQLENQRIKSQIAMKQYADAMAHFKGMKTKLEGTQFGRQVLIAVDKFAGAAGENFDPDCIEFFHMMDAVGESAEAELISGKASEEDLMTAPYFVKLIFDDPLIKESKGMVAGTEMKRTNCKIKVSYEVQAMSGKIITSGNVTEEKSIRETNAVSVKGSSQELLVETMEQALVKVAKRINDYFVAKVSVKIQPAKKDKEFDADSATVEIDGENLDGEISVIKGKHTITVDLDGYKQKGSIRFDIRKSGPVKVVVKKVEEKKDE